MMKIVIKDNVDEAVASGRTAALYSDCWRSFFRFVNVQPQVLDNFFRQSHLLYGIDLNGLAHHPSFYRHCEAAKATKSTNN